MSEKLETVGWPVVRQDQHESILSERDATIEQQAEQLAAAQKDAALMASIKRAAKELPAGWQIELVVEAEAGWVQLRNPDGDFLEFNDSDLELDEQVNAAIDAAQEVKS